GADAREDCHGAGVVGVVVPRGEQRLVLGQVLCGVRKWPHPQQPSACRCRSGNSRGAKAVSYCDTCAAGGPVPPRGHNWRNGRIHGTMVTGTALADPEGRLADEAGRVESEATHPVQPERNAAGTEWSLPTWEEIVRLHSARVYRLAYRLTGNPHDAEDLTQEVFVRVFRSLSSYTP